ncbi:MobA-like protein [Oleiphilus messinensis]|uniref:MobA-like protein n=1 Tax=Oleiphilus messinensis TaxID=141451 RepID=A0A1Y0I3U5_9GAMM|nr:nucleotidyltransferase family protein [Oleiphilus messinensis]ARU55147.1 MobA-like protein [Oleiphilus messinensis]
MSAAPKILTLAVLAAGLGRRFIGGHKLLAPLPDGSRVIDRVLDTAAHAAHVLQSEQSVLPVSVKVMVVLREEDRSLLQEVVQARERLVSLADLELLLLSASEEVELATRIKAVINHAPSDGWLFMLGDMPFVQFSTVVALGSAFFHTTKSEQYFFVPVQLSEGGAKRGNPVLIGSTWRSQLLELCGDQGANPLLKQHSNAVVHVPVDDPGIHRDIDRVEDLPGFSS